MNDFLAHLKQGKLMQWAVACIGSVFALIQMIGVVSGSYQPDGSMHLAFAAPTADFIAVTMPTAAGFRVAGSSACTGSRDPP
ncbi:MAG: hypothetical protein ACREP2_07880 [Rhodanobacteraceae bacterium]